MMCVRGGLQLSSLPDYRGNNNNPFFGGVDALFTLHQGRHSAIKIGGVRKVGGGRDGGRWIYLRGGQRCAPAIQKAQNGSWPSEGLLNSHTTCAQSSEILQEPWGDGAGISGL